MAQRARPCRLQRTELSLSQRARHAPPDSASSLNSLRLGRVRGRLGIEGHHECAADERRKDGLALECRDVEKGGPINTGSPPSLGRLLADSGFVMYFVLYSFVCVHLYLVLCFVLAAAVRRHAVLLGGRRLLGDESNEGCSRHEHDHEHSEQRVRHRRLLTHGDDSSMRLKANEKHINTGEESSGHVYRMVLERAVHAPLAAVRTPRASSPIPRVGPMQMAAAPLQGHRQGHLQGHR